MTHLAFCFRLGLGWLLFSVSGCTSTSPVMPPERAPVAASTQSSYVNVRGGVYHLPGPDQCKAVALVFVGVECPVSNSYAPEIASLCREYGPKRIMFCVVYPDPDLTISAARKHAGDYAFPCPAVLDSDLRLASKVGATLTPEVALLSPTGQLLYRGRIDDRYFALGQQRAQPTQRDLRQALDAVLAGRPVPVPRTQPIGCYISFPARTPS
jgi:hypothetical protein